MRRARLHRRAGLPIIMAMMSTAAAAQLPPNLSAQTDPERINAEARRRNEERVTQPAPPPPATLVETPKPPAAAGADENEVRFILTGIRFDKSAYLDEAELDALGAPLIGRSVSIADLRGLVDRINALYAARGLATARAALPTQDIADGMVVIRLVEGRIGAVSAEGGSPGSRRQALASLGLPAGALADPRSVEQRLRRFNLGNDTQLRARLAPGTSFGNIDVVIAVAEPRRLQLDLFTDNSGFDSTGTMQAGAVPRGYRLLTAADRASLVLVKSRGVTSQSASYGVELLSGLRVELNGSHGTTSLITPAPASLAVCGESSAFGAELTGVIAVGSRWTVVAGAAARAMLSNTVIGGEQVVDNQALAASASLSLGYAAPGFAFNARSELGINRVRERISATQRSPLTWRGALFLARAFDQNATQLRLRADWQLSNATELPGLLQYQIGGARSTRAFAPGVASGDNGLSAAVELATGFSVRRLTVEPFAFVDHAYVEGPSGTLSLNGIGAGVAVQLGRRLDARATYAYSLGGGGLPATTNRFFGSLTLRL